MAHRGQLGRDLRLRAVEQLRARAQDQEARAVRLDLPEQVAAHHHRAARPRVPAQRREQRADPARIEPDQRLVEHEQARRVDQRRRHRHLLAHAARERLGERVAARARARARRAARARAAPSPSRRRAARRARGAPRPRAARTDAARRARARAGASPRADRARGRRRRSRSRPASGARIPATQRSVVVLPAPFGPTRPRISPARTSKPSASTATRSSKRLVSSLTTSMASDDSQPLRSPSDSLRVGRLSSPSLQSVARRERLRGRGAAARARRVVQRCALLVVGGAREPELRAHLVDRQREQRLPVLRDHPLRAAPDPRSPGAPRGSTARPGTRTAPASSPSSAMNAVPGVADLAVQHAEQAQLAERIAAVAGQHVPEIVAVARPVGERAHVRIEAALLVALVRGGRRGRPRSGPRAP